MLDPDQWADPLWRLSNLYTIVTDDGKEIRFTPNEEQIELYRALHNRNLVLKARQLGFTTFLAIVALDQCLFVANYTAVLIAHTLPDAKKIFRNKIKRVYDALPQAIRDACPLAKEAAEELVFENGSSFSVTTSARGGTTNFLHVSEMGKIARAYPEKAAEIVTGAFESVPADGIIVVESTAEGREGWYYDACMTALRAKQQGQRLTRMDFKLHFFPWFNKAAYALTAEEAESVQIGDKDREKLAKLEAAAGVRLTPGQRAWWVKKRQTLNDMMAREYPGTPEEAFAVALEGTVYGLQMAAVRRAGRIGRCPVRQGVVVNTYWDFGVDDSTSIWLHQRVGAINRFVRYHEKNSEGLAYYWKWLNDWRVEHDAEWGRHFLPHDGDTRIQGYEVTTRRGMLADLGMRNIVIVPRVQRLDIGIAAVRQILLECEFDEEGCAEGIKALDFYSYEWDEAAGCYTSRPRHNAFSHGADAFRQFAQSWGQGAARPQDAADAASAGYGGGYRGAY